MRFTPTEKFQFFAKSTGNNIAWRVYIKPTTDISEPLSSGTWIEVTDKIIAIPDAASTIEYEIGQFTSDSITLEGDDIQYWTNIFNVPDATYIEMKIVGTLGQNGDLCTDEAIIFSGFIDKIGVTYTESSNTVSFTAFTAQELGNRIAAENLTTQYVEQDVQQDGTNIHGLFLLNVPGLFVTNANLADEELQLGDHVLGYSFNQDSFAQESNQILNGTFANGTDGWVTSSGWTVAGNKITAPANHPGINFWQYQTVQANDNYTLTYTISNRTAGSVAVLFNNFQVDAQAANGTFTSHFALPVNNNVFKFIGSPGPSFAGSISNISLTKDAKIVNNYILKLDGGRETRIESQNAYTIVGNGEDVNSDTQQVRVYCRATGSLPVVSVDSNLVVINEGQILPNQWYTNVGLRFLLSVIYNKLGITNTNIGNLEIQINPFADRPTEISFLDTPPNDGTVLGNKWAITTDGTDLFIPVGNKIYRRSKTSEQYTLLATLPDVKSLVSKLMYNARNNHLWIYYGTNTNGQGNGLLRRYDITGNILSAELSLQTSVPFAADVTSYGSIELVDFNYSGILFKYGIAFTDASSTNKGRLRFVDGVTLAITTALNGDTDYGFPSAQADSINSHFMFVRNGNEVWFKAGGVTQFSDDALLKSHINGAGVFISDGVILTPIDPYFTAAYSPVEDRIYYWLKINTFVASHTPNNATTSINLFDMSFNADIFNMFYGGGTVWFTLIDYDPFIAGKFYYLYGYTHNEVHDFQNYEELSNQAGTQFTQLTFSDRLFGLDTVGRLFQYSSFRSPYSQEAVFAGTTITDALNQSLQSFDLVGNISSTKKATVFVRGDTNGRPVTSGNTLALSLDEISDVQKNTFSYSKVGLVEVSNGTDKANFNGTTFNTTVLSDTRTLSLSNALIPKELLEDLAYTIFQFLKTDKTLYTFEIVQPLYQFEPLDNCNFSVNNGKIIVAVNGDGFPIYTTDLKPDGTMTIGVLV